MKATHGLVPYTGVMPIELTLDHTGPITSSVADNALFLEVLAGPDGLDPRQMNITTAPYTQALNGGAKGIRIGVVREGFGYPNSEQDVDALVKKAAEIFASWCRGAGRVDPNASCWRGRRSAIAHKAPQCR